MKNAAKKHYNAAIYVRLSKEDGDIVSGDKHESDSISNQKTLIRDFLTSQPNITVVAERVDDGFSGMNFNRPAFSAMFADIKSGKVDCVVVKDLSRFGRNYVEVGRYVTKIFPLYGVRFIAINDNFDTLNLANTSDDLLFSFKNLMNDSYCKDISTKVRSHLTIKRKRGEFIGAFAPYGYAKDPKNHNQLVIDEDAAAVVQDIFNWKLEGASPTEIANRLNQFLIPSPSEYKKLHGQKFCSGYRTKNIALWTAVTVRRILKNEVYLGTMVQGKTTTPSAKVKRKISIQESEWIKIENTHDPIIGRIQFEVVQDVLKKDTRTAPEKTEVYPLSGLLFCGNCGSPVVHRITGNYGYRYSYYNCSANNMDSSKCKKYRIREEVINDTVLKLIQGQIQVALDLDLALQRISNLPMKQFRQRSLHANIDKIQDKIAHYEQLRLSLYDDWKSGLIDQEEFADYKASFTLQIEQARSAIAKIEQDLSDLEQCNGGQRQWLKEFISYQNITTLDRKTAVTFIDRIMVYENNEIDVVFKHEDWLRQLSEYVKQNTALMVIEEAV